MGAPCISIGLRRRGGFGALGIRRWPFGGCCLPGDLRGGRIGLFPVSNMAAFWARLCGVRRGSVGSTYRRAAYAHSDCDLTPGMDFLTKLYNLIAAEYEAGPAYRSPAARAFPAGTVEPGAGAFADSDSFLSGDGG